MSRCRACDRKMTEQELCHKTVDRITQKFVYTDVCFRCSNTEDDYTEFIKVVPIDSDE